MDDITFKCPECDGKGFMAQVETSKVNGETIELKTQTICALCDGEGKVNENLFVNHEIQGFPGCLVFVLALYAVVAITALTDANRFIVFILFIVSAASTVCLLGWLSNIANVKRFVRLSKEKDLLEKEKPKVIEEIEEPDYFEKDDEPVQLSEILRKR